MRVTQVIIESPAESPAEQPPVWARSSRTCCRAALPPRNPDQPIRMEECSTAQNEAFGPNWVTELKDGFMEKQVFFFFKGQLHQTTKQRAESDQLIHYLTPDLTCFLISLLTFDNQRFKLQPLWSWTLPSMTSSPRLMLSPALTTSQGFTFAAVVFRPTRHKHVTADEQSGWRATLDARRTDGMTFLNIKRKTYHVSPSLYMAS